MSHYMQSEPLNLCQNKEPNISFSHDRLKLPPQYQTINHLSNKNHQAAAASVMTSTHTDDSVAAIFISTAGLFSSG